MKNFQGIIKLNSAEQNEQMAWYCIENSEIGRFKQLLHDGMKLNAFMLTAMVFFGHRDALIKEVLQEALTFDDDVIQWMRGYFEVDELAEVLPRYQKKLPKDWPSNEDCARLKLWTTLCNRREFSLVAQNAPELLIKSTLSGYNSVWVALLKVDFAKYAPQALEKGYYSAFLAKDGWWKYLVDNDRADWLLKRGDKGGLLPEKEIAEYCYHKGLFDELLNNKYDEILLKYHNFAVYVKHHSFRKVFLSQYPEQVDWEDLWQRSDTKELQDYLLELAARNKEVPKCREFLARHYGFWKQILLFLD